MEFQSRRRSFSSRAEERRASDTSAEPHVAIQLEDELRLIQALRAGDERAFLNLLRVHHAAMLRVASGYVGAGSAAEDVVQEAWQGLLESLPRFDPRTATLETWLFRSLVHAARARHRKERRSSAGAAAREPSSEPQGVASDRFRRADQDWAGHWAKPPRPFELADPSHDAATAALLNSAIQALPEAQREALILCDVERFALVEVCFVLALTEPQLHGLLHRARAALRGFLEQRLTGRVGQP